MAHTGQKHAACVFAFLLMWTMLLLAGIALADDTVTRCKDGDVISKDTVWQGRILVEGVVLVPEGVTLTIMPGTVAAFKKTAKESKEEGGASEVLIPGSGIRVEGRIIAEGTKDSRITFTSAAPAGQNPSAGDWGCIFLDHSKGSVFKYCVFEYSAYTLHAHFSRFDVSRCILTNNEDGSRLGVCRVNFDHCDITGNTGKGLNFRQCNNTVTNCNITGNHEGIFLNEKDAGCRMENNNIYGNKGMDLRLGEFHAEDVSLKGNWWGTNDLSEIGRHVYDKEDDPALGKASIEQATGEVTGAGVDGLSVNVKWKFKTGGYVDSSAAESDGTVFFGSWDKSFYAVRADTGELLWKFGTGDCVDSSPAVSDGKVVFGSWDRNIYCLNKDDGSLVWKYEMPPSNFDDHRQASPTVAGGTIYMGGFNGSLYAIEQKDGHLKWEFTTGGPIRCRPVCIGWSDVVGGFVGVRSYRLVIAGSADGALHSVDAGTGRELWRFEAGGPVFSSPDILIEGVDRFNDKYSDIYQEISILRVYFGSRDGKIYRLDGRGGKLLWSYKTGGAIEYSSPLIAGSRVIIGSTDGKLYSLDKEKGTLAWSFDCGAAIYSSPLLAGGRVVVGDNGGRVFFLDKEAGRPLGVFRAGDAVQSLSAGTGGVVYAGSRDGFMYALAVGE